jgi:hypothetical protein
MRAGLAVILLMVSAAAVAADAGEIKVVRGSAYLERAGERLSVQVGMPVREADRVITGANGTVGITFADNSLLSIGPNSNFAIERYVFDSTTHIGQFDSRLNRGTLAGVSGKIVKQTPEAMRVHTPSAIMGVRGTEFVVQVDPKH